MSSSDEEVVRRPGRSTDASRVQSPSASERSASPNGRAESPLGSDKLNADDDADLFGSDGDLEEYGNTMY